MTRPLTAYLLTCAVLGVAGAVLLAPANWISTALLAGSAVANVAVAGLWILPAVVAMRLLERPGAALLVGLISGLAIVPFSGYGFTSVLTNLWWAFFIELGFLAVLYRFWTIPQYYAGAVVLSVAYPLLSAEFFDLWSQPSGVVIAFFGVMLVSCLAATALGILIADRLTKAGVARSARRRPRVAVKTPDAPPAVPAE
ncbi:ECF transporter S component [Pseudolysinimonas sp.]|jgi:energy-coupling factor transport system substrate-specific component